MDKAKGEMKSQLDRSAWINAAIELLADDGLDGIRVEVLAKRLHVTKGSFYWHFKDRQDLLEAVLDTWRQGRIRDILKQTRADPGREQDRLYHVIAVYLARGLSRDEASCRCMLLYAYVFGQSLLNCQRIDVDPVSLKERIADLITG